MMNRNLDDVFESKEKVRDIEKCRMCKYFHDHGDIFGCGNVLKGHGHPWCSESYEPLKKEWFEKASIFIADHEKCMQNKHQNTMKIDELKNGDVVVQCIDIEQKSTYTPPVRKRMFTVVVDSYGIVLDDGEGCQHSPDFSEGRWYLQKKRDWTPDEMRGLVGKTITDDFGTRLIVEYNNGNGTVVDSSGFKRLGPGEVGSVFGEKYDLIEID